MAKYPNKKTSFTKRPISPVKAKKHLGQHFLNDEEVAGRIGNTLSFNGYENIVEIGPGTGVLTKYLLRKQTNLIAIDLDRESIAYLRENFSLEHTAAISQMYSFNILDADFLKLDITQLFNGQPFAITGNFPYNISSQIVFKTIENKELIPEFTGMFQKEVAKRICASEGSKTYGILSVLTQAFYEAEYLFTVGPQVFNPPPKVDSGVLRLTRKIDYALDCDEKLFFRVVKMAFNQRRKTLRNSLKMFGLPAEVTTDPLFQKRPEQLAVTGFVELTIIVAQHKTN